MSNITPDQQRTSDDPAAGLLRAANAVLEARMDIDQWYASIPADRLNWLRDAVIAVQERS